MQARFELPQIPNIIIIGAGAAGFSSALELADKGYSVTIIEQNTIGSGASGRNPGRMGHGFHYVDIETAKMYLRESIRVQRKYPGFLIGEDLPFSASIRHGRYFITKNSDYPKEQILLTYEAIREEYQRLISEDPTNEVFGSPESFFRILHPSEYEGIINGDIIDIGVETAEHLFNWANFLPEIKRKILTHPNITLYEHMRVDSFRRGELHDPRFIVQTSTPYDEQRSFACDFIINSTWENIEYLNDKIGILMTPESRTNRLKTLLIVRLPESLRHSNSMFFCMGQHCMISNLGDGRAMMTYAKVTNMEASSDLKMSGTARRLLDGGATQEEKDIIAQQMLDGIKAYIPEMAHAIPENVLFGIVQTEGKLTLQELTNHKSGFHKRNYFGVREEQIGLISNPCIKLFYFAGNGALTANLIEKHIKVTALIYHCMREIEQKAIEERIILTSEIKNTLLLNLERYESSDLSELTTDGIIVTLLNAIKQKKIAIDQTKSSFFSTKVSDTVSEIDLSLTKIDHSPK